MKYTALAATCGLALCLALPAAAQQTSSSSTNSSSTSSQNANSQNTPAIQQQVKQDLQKAGFTDVQIMPQSFLVRAHDKEGRPVMMVINPDSVLSVTRLGGESNNNGNAKSGNSSANNSTASK